MLKKFCLSALIICAGLPAFAQLTQDQKVADFMQLAGIYAKNYAPYELRRDVFGFDLYNVKPWLEQIAKSTDDISFYDICVRYVASLQDSHDEFTLPSTFEAWLHMDVDLYDGKVLIGFIDRGYLPTKTYPFVVGDEIVSVDGVGANDLITKFIPYAVNGSGSKISQRRLAAGAITDRYQGWMPIATSIGKDASVVIRRQNGNMETYTITWDLFGTPITKEGPVDSPRALASRSSSQETLVRSNARQIHPRQRHNNPWGVFEGPAEALPPDAVPEYMSALNKLQEMRALRPAAAVSSVGIDPFDVFTPIFNPPAGFKLRLGARTTDQFLSGTFPVGTNTIGFIRIPSFAPSSTSTALNQFFAEVTFFQANTDALVIDVMGNGGGSICYAQSLASQLIPTPFRGATEVIRPTLQWQASFGNALQNAKNNGAPQWVINLYTHYLAEVQQALASPRGDTGPLPLCSFEINQNPPVDASGNVLSFTKPILILTDSFTLSSAELFTMFLQDNKRATVFGTGTDGGGGNVVGYSNITAYSEGNARVTEGLITRLNPVQVPGFPLLPFYDGVGINPDIKQDYQTLDNLLNGGKPFVTALSTAVVNLIPKK